MNEFLKFLEENWSWILQAFQSFLTLVFIVLYKWTNRKGKDIDRDGIPDVPARFNSWFVVIDGRKYPLKDLTFFEEEEDAKK